jgi:hypothetical protein
MDWFIKLMIAQLTPSIKIALKKAIDDLEKLAKDTPNQYDDMLIAFLRNVLSC